MFFVEGQKPPTPATFGEISPRIESIQGDRGATTWEIEYRILKPKIHTHSCICTYLRFILLMSLLWPVLFVLFGDWVLLCVFCDVK